MDFMDRLKDSINSIPNLNIKCVIGYLKPSDSLVLYSLPGGKVTQEYYNGTKDQELNYEIAMKSKDQEQNIKTLWLIENHLRTLQELRSNDSSFDFLKIELTSLPYISSEDEQDYFIFAIDIKATITTY